MDGRIGRPEAGTHPARGDGARRGLHLGRGGGLARALVAPALGLVVGDALDLLAHLVPGARVWVCEGTCEGVRGL